MAKRAKKKQGAQRGDGAWALYEMQAEICSALASPVRLQILDLVSQGEKTSTELLENLSIPKANLSQHIAVLCDAGILVRRKEGLFQYLTIGLPKIREACALVKGILVERVEQDERRAADLRRQLKTQRGVS